MLPGGVWDGLLWAGPSFTVQVKSNLRPLVFRKPHEIKWVKELENPFFVAVGYPWDQHVEIYSTWARLIGFEGKDAERITFRYGPPAKGRDLVWTPRHELKRVKAPKQEIALGEPIIRATVQDFMNESRAKALSEVLKQWIELDRSNIVNNLAHMHWVVGPQSYQTNERFTVDRMHIFWNGKNLRECQVNFGRAATELRLTIRNALLPEGERNSIYATEVSALDGVLRAYWRNLDLASQEALRRHVGLTP